MTQEIRQDGKSSLDGALDKAPCVGIDRAGKIVEWSPEAADLYGYSAEEILGEPLSTIYPANPVLKQSSFVGLVFEGECVENVESFQRTKEGRFLRATASFLPRRGDDEEINGVTLIIQHVSAYEMEGAIEKERGLWSWAVVETAVDAVITIDESAKIEYMNRSGLRMFGYELEEILGKNVNILMPEPYHGEHDGYIENYLTTGRKKIIGIGREVIAQRRDGTVFPVHLSVSEVLIGDHRIFTGVIRDISVQKKAETERARLLVELNRRNRELNCLYRSGEVLRASEVSRSTFVKVAEYLHSALAHPNLTGTRIIVDGEHYTNEPFQETPWILSTDVVAEGRKRGRVEVFFLRDDLSQDVQRRIEIEEMPLVEGVASILGEAIERKEAESKVFHASKLASVGELAAGVGHEINNPINGIMNCADILMREAPEGSKTRKYAELVRSEAERVSVIVHNLLTFSRQEKSQYSAARLKDIVDGVVSLCSKKIAKSHVHLHIDVPEGLPRLRCRSEQLQQVLMNLVINAMHSLQEKYPEADPDKRLSITAEPTTIKKEAFLRLAVEDHGKGIPPEHIERIFDPFFTTKGRDQGTGLGLSVSDGIVKAHDGSITVQSELGKWTRFCVDLPVDGGVRTPPANSE